MRQDCDGNHSSSVMQAGILFGSHLHYVSLSQHIAIAGKFPLVCIATQIYFKSPMAKRNGFTLESAVTKLWIGYGVVVALKGRKFDNLVETLVESPRLQSTTTPPNFLMACDLHRAVAAPFSLLEYAGSILRTTSRQCEEASGSNSGLQRPCIQ